VLKLGVLISGRGSNLQALIDATQQLGFPASIACVISNDPSAKGLDRARAANIPALAVNHRDFKDRQSFEQALDAKLTEQGVQLVCLAGFMRLLTPWFVEKAIDYGVKFAGCTVHFVRPEMDHGPIILQAAVPVLADDTEDELAARVLEAEHKAYPQAVRYIAENRVNVLDEKVFIVDTGLPPQSTICPVDTATLAKSRAAQ
jgi:phosphoribosylglycinamide formyltransferase-1